MPVFPEIVKEAGYPPRETQPLFCYIEVVAATASESGTARGDVPNVDDNIPGALTSPLEVTPMSGQWQTESMPEPLSCLGFDR